MRIANVACMLIAVVLSWLLGACATIPGGPTAGLAPSPGQVVERLEARRLSVRTLAMQGEILGQSRQGELSGEQRILGRYPDRLRAEVMGPFDRPVLLLVSDGARLTVLAYGENKAYVGPASRKNVSRFLGLSLTPAEIYALLSGNVPLVPRGQQQVMLSSEQGKALLKVNDKAGLDEGLIFSLGDYTIYEAWLREPTSGLGLTCRFNSFASQTDGRFPRHIELTDSDQRTLTITNDRLQINQPVDDKSFEVQLPPGLEVQELP